MKMIPPEAKKVFEGVLFDVYQWEQEMFDGTTATFERLHRTDGITVIPVLPDGRIIMALDEQPRREKVLTFPSGRLEKGEEVLETAKRELLEETGYQGEMVHWRSTSPSSKIEWEQHYYIARNCEKVQEQQLDGGERIEVLIMTLDEVLAKADDPLFQNRGIAIDLLKARYDAEARKEFEQLLYGK